MKTLKCDLCDHEEQAETFEEWMNVMKSHYGEAHAEFMKEQGVGKTDEEKMAGMQKWMAENRARFETS